MKKTLGLLLLLAILHQQINSQLSNYSFAASSGTYTDITGTPATVSALSNGVTALLPIGFTFWYNGISYTDFGASTNGKIRLGGVFTAATEGGSYTLSDHPERPILAPLFDHLRLSSASGLTYQTTGTAPNRILTVQWAQVYWPAGEISPAIEFQLKLYENSNRLEFIYKPLGGSNLGAFASIGLCIVPTGTANFRNLTNTGTNPGVSTGTYILSTKPALGQTYAFFPQLCYGPPTGGTAVTPNISICSGFNVTASVTGDTQAPFGLTYQWQSSPDGTTWTNIPSAASKTLSRTQTAPTYYRRGITCAGITNYSTPVFVPIGSVPAQYAALPYSQDFETEWISNCGNRELPSYNWRNTPLSGDRSWRRDDDYIAGGWTNNTGAPLTIGNTTHSARFHIRDEFIGPPPTSGDLDLYVDCSTPGNKELRFKHYQSETRVNLALFYSTDAGASFNPLAQVPGAKEWRDVSFLLPSNSATTIVRFRGTGRPFASASDHAIDNVQVLAVNCLYPTGLNISAVQSNSAKATWNSVAGAEGFEYAVITGFGGAQAPASGTFTTSSSIVLNTLTTGTSYWFHVRTKCGAGSYSSWQSIYFGTAINCSAATAINCGTPLPVHFDHGSGSYSLFESDPSGNCGEPTYGYEKLLIFKPQVTGVYSLTTTGFSGGAGVDYYIKDAAQGCAPIGWTCIGITTNPKTFSLGTLTAGKEYFILLDNFSIVNGHDETLTITCPAANTDCVSGSITPSTGSICGTGTQLLTTSGGTSYQWFRNGVMINGAVQNTYNASLPGNYTVSITNGTCTKLAANSVVITQTSIPGPTITGPDLVSFCDGNNYLLTSSAATGNQWYKDGVLISGGVNQSLSVTTSGSYTVTSTIGSCVSDPSAPIVVTVYSNPAIPTITPGGSTGFCPGGNVQLSIPAASGISYQWLKDNSSISGANSNTYNALAGGSYTVRVTNGNNCSAVSAATVVTAFSNPAVPVITPGGPLTFCSGDAVILTSSSATGNQWLKDGNVISSATGTAYSANSSGNYAVVVTNGNNCSATSAGTVVTVNSLPAKPTISAAANLLTSSAASNNQWLLNGSPISGATSQTYTALASGNYAVQVTVNNCSNTSDSYNFVATAIVDPVAWNNEVSAFPNPTSDKLYILNQGNRKLAIRLVDTNGKTVLENNAPVNSIPLSLKKLPAGIYLLMITDIKKKETLVKTILKK